ncbi:TIGR01777 family oxidoreductase [Ectobacillus ponti]|uniref:TIGR01777 family oxidoreductase n=1 Tax=Ectobacillus ponti TaxID=2961894 RepID=A0AA41X943_9BACI|nr:TIGR01777 family oxidoreductase [Ectobacillus ponti]MCP8970987.1 TIGR01777 family oxidoreductase [Ectobacillus ponti]
MEIAISGGTGFIGKALSAHLAAQGHTVYILTRHSGITSANRNIQYLKWSAQDPALPIRSLDAFINLAGEPINSGRWTESKKAQILNSRVDTVKGILRQLQALPRKPKVFINASAIGYYGPSPDKTFTEDDRRPGHDFLAQTVVRWEEEAGKAEEMGIRTVLTRFGIVLGQKGGALPRIVLPYKLFIGGTVGSGRQWMSWVHLDDVVGMLAFALENEAVRGPLNITAPAPVTMKEFGQTIAKVIRRPHWIPVPAFALKLLLGEMSTLVLDGQRVLPERAVQHGYVHKYPDLQQALHNILT